MFEEARPRSEGVWDEFREIVKQSEPSIEYKEGKKRLHFTHRFSTGHNLEVSENDEGLVSFVISFEGKTLIDLSKSHFIGPGYKVVSPSYLISHNIVSEKIGDFYTSVPDNDQEEALIVMGDMRSPYHILSAIHEIGHSWVPNIPTAKETILDRKQKRPVDAPHSHVPLGEKAELISYLERTAWAAALRIVRVVKEEYGLDLFESFKSREKIRKQIMLSMASYRYDLEEKTYMNAWKLLWAEREKGSTRKSPKDSEWDVFGDLFDKKAFSQKGLLNFEAGEES